jgi:hypothetical protein
VSPSCRPSHRPVEAARRSELVDAAVRSSTCRARLRPEATRLPQPRADRAAASPGISVPAAAPPASTGAEARLAYAGYREPPSPCSRAKYASVRAESHATPASVCPATPPFGASPVSRPAPLPPPPPCLPRRRSAGVVSLWPFSSEPAAMARSFDRPVVLLVTPCSRLWLAHEAKPQLGMDWPRALPLRSSSHQAAQLTTKFSPVVFSE